MKNESKTLFIPLYGKAMMSRCGFFSDETAEKIAESQPEAFQNVDTSKRLAVYMAMRAMQYDSLTEQFLKKNPDGAVVHLGCGLDSRCKRVKVPCRMWYDLDFPEVIELRKQYYPENAHHEMIASSATDAGWLSRIDDAGNPVLILAEGISMYLTETEMRALFARFQKRFVQTTFVFDAYSTFSAKVSRLKNPINAVNAKVSFAMDEPSLFEDTEKGIRCTAVRKIIRKEYIAKLSGLLRHRFSFMGKAGSKMYRIYEYDIEGEQR